MKTVAFSLASVLCAAALASADAVVPTKVVVFRPYLRDGHLDARLRIVQHVKGECWVPSLATIRGNAWRCSSGHYIYDPCFSARATAKQVVCPRDVFKHTAMLLTLTRSLPPPDDSRGNVVERLRPPDIEPWMLSLPDGSYCVFAVGATFTVGKRRANYSCTSGRWVVGYPQERRTGRWTVAVVDGPRANSPRTVSITVAVL